MDELLINSRMNDPLTSFGANAAKTGISKKEKNVQSARVRSEADMSKNRNNEWYLSAPTEEERQKSVQKAQEQQREKAEEEQAKWDRFFDSIKRLNSIQNKKSISYSSYRDLAKIASATTVPSINAVAKNIRSQMGKIRNSGADPEQVANVLSKMRNALRKADAKAVRLRMEIQIEQEKQLAQYLKEIEEEKRLDDDLRLRKRTRKGAEYTDMMSGAAADAYQSQNTSASSPAPPVVDTVSVGDVGLGNSPAVDFKF